jgi:hypothetical protein
MSVIPGEREREREERKREAMTIKALLVCDQAQDAATLCNQRRKLHLAASATSVDCALLSTTNDPPDVLLIDSKVTRRWFSLEGSCVPAPALA